MIECSKCGKKIDVMGEGYYAKGLDDFKIYCMECNDKEFNKGRRIRMKEPDNSFGREPVDSKLVAACDAAMELIKKGLQPGLAIWKVAQESGHETTEIASELGHRKKRK